MQELLSNLGINWKLLLAQAINFLLVLWVLNRFVFKKLLAYLENRKKTIEKGVELTAKAEQEIARIDQARKRELDEARAKGEALVQEAKALARDKAQETLLFAKQAEERILLKAQQDAQTQKEEALKAAQSEIRKLGLLFAQKVLERTLSEKDEERMAKEAFHELPGQSYAK